MMMNNNNNNNNNFNFSFIVEEFDSSHRHAARYLISNNTKYKGPGANSCTRNLLHNNNDDNNDNNDDEKKNGNNTTLSSSCSSSITRKTKHSGKYKKAAKRGSENRRGKYIIKIDSESIFDERNNSKNNKNNNDNGKSAPKFIESRCTSRFGNPAVEMFRSLTYRFGVHRRRIRKKIEEVCCDTFLPADVTDDYWAYARWRGLQRICSSVLSTYATQSMLVAVGIGRGGGIGNTGNAGANTARAAAFSWVMKDGLGRLGRFAVAAGMGSSFDSDLKRVRFSSSLLYNLCTAMEISTPLFPSQFLPIATIANVGKSVGITCSISTQPSFFKSFATKENLADIAAKQHAQTVVADTLGLAIAVGLSALFGRFDAPWSKIILKNRMNSLSNIRKGAKFANLRSYLPFVAFPPLATLDLFSIYKELKAVELKTLNRDRAELAARVFVARGKVPTPKEMTSLEQLFGESCSCRTEELYNKGSSDVEYEIKKGWWSFIEKWNQKFDGNYIRLKMVPLSVLDFSTAAWNDIYRQFGFVTGKDCNRLYKNTSLSEITNQATANDPLELHSDTLKLGSDTFSNDSHFDDNFVLHSNTSENQYKKYILQFQQERHSGDRNQILGLAGSLLTSCLSDFVAFDSNKRNTAWLGLAMESSADEIDILTGILHAEHFRQTLSSSSGRQPYSVAPFCYHPRSIRNAIDDSSLLAKRDIAAFVEELKLKGYQLKPFLQSARERHRWTIRERVLDAECD